jgi:hypothetical protein
VRRVPHQTLNLTLQTGTTGAAGAGYGGTSATSTTIGTGSKTFTMAQPGLAYLVGDYVRVKSNANGANYMEGIVSAYSGTTLTVNVTVTGGSGTFTDWNFNQSGAPGGVTSIAGNTGAFTLGTGLTNATNDLRVSLPTASNVLGADVALSATASYFDGPGITLVQRPW